MATPQQEQETATPQPTSSPTSVNAVGEYKGPQDRISSDEEENDVADPASDSLPGSPIPGIRGSEEELFSQDESTYPDEPVYPGATTRSPSLPSDIEGERTSTVGPPTDGSSNDELPSPFPPPRNDQPLSSPGVHPGPADTSSIASSHPPFQFNPRAAPYERIAEAYLRRGAGPGAREPMDLPNERPEGDLVDEDARARRVRDAIYHMAMYISG